MSTTLAPTKWIALPGGQVLLPPDARPDLAFQRSFFANPSAQHGFTLGTVGADYYEVLTNAQFQYSTASTAGNTPYIQLTVSPAQTGFPVYLSNPGFAQAQATTFEYQFSTSVTAAFSSSSTIAGIMAPLPLLAGVAGNVFKIVGDPLPSHADSIANVFWTIVYIPTGDIDGAEANAAPAAVAPMLIT